MYVRESTIVGYAYRADLWCEACLREEPRIVQDIKPAPNGCVSLSAELMLDMLASRNGIDRNDEYSFDSDDFPKIVTLGHLDFHSNEDLDECGECGERLGV